MNLSDNDCYKNRIFFVRSTYLVREEGMIEGMQDFMFITTWTDDLNTNLFLSSYSLSETSSKTNKSSQKEVMSPFKSEILPRKFGVNITVYTISMLDPQIQNTKVMTSGKRKESRKFLKRFYVLQTLCTI